MSNDFANIQKLYEEGYRGQSYDPGPNAKYEADEAPYGYSYRKGGLPTGYPSAGGYSTYNAGQAGSYGVPSAVIISGDEEVEAAEIINLDVLKKLDEIVKDLDPENHNDRAVMSAMGKLKDHIIFLSQGRLD